MPKYDFNKVAKLQSNFIEITLPHGCSPVKLLHMFRTPIPKNTYWWLLLLLAGNTIQKHPYSLLNLQLDDLFME